MSNNWICTMHSAQERNQFLTALQQAGIPADHVRELRPASQGNDPKSLDGDVDGGFWPIADGAMCAFAGGAFGAYVSVFSLLFPRLQPLHDLGPGIIILGAAAVCAGAGMIISLGIKACYPQHARLDQQEATMATPVTMTIHGVNGRESQLIHEVLEATGHGDSVNAAE
jgi:hypothetical protein